MDKRKAFAIILSVTCLLIFLIRENVSKLTFEEISLRRPLKCKGKPFEGTILILVFNFPFYKNIPYLRQMYGGVFSKVIFCGPVLNTKDCKEKVDIVLKHENGYLGYHCAAKAIQLYPGYKGYMYGNDDMIINWWNLVDRDRNKIWQGPEFTDFRQKLKYKLIRADWVWWNSTYGLSACKHFYSDLQKLAETSTVEKHSYQTALRNGQGFLRCGKGWSDFFYIPGTLSKRFLTMSELAFRRKLFLEIAVNNMLRSLDDFENFEIIKGTFLPDVGVKVNRPKIFWARYDLRQTFIHPFKIGKVESKFNIEMLKTKVIQRTQKLLTPCKA